MNERILELARRVVGKRKDDVESISLFDEQIEKFAELIARECIKQVDEAIPETDCSASYAYRTARIAAISRIKEHFGVE